MSTQEVTYTVPSNGWTGTVDVTNANLLSDITIKDFKVFYNGVEQGATQLALWAKTSSTILTYSGAALNQNDVVIIWRDTPNSVVQTVTSRTTILSALWNSEFDRIVRRAEEQDAFYNSTTPSSGTISDTAYGAGWNGVTGDAPSKNAVYDMMNSTNTHSGDFTLSGDNTHTGANVFSSTVTFDASSDVVFDSSCPITGTVDMDASTAVLVPTRSRTDAGGEFTTNAASQAWVYSAMGMQNIFDARLSIHSTDPIGRGAGSTIYLHPYKGNCVTLYNNSRWEPHFMSGTVSLAVGTLTDNLPYDIYLYNNAGTLTLEKLAWTSATARATALTTQNGVYVKTGDTSRRFVGTIYSPGSNTVTVSDERNNVTYSGSYITTICHCGISNHYHSVPINFVKYDSNALGNLQNTQYPAGTTAFTLAYNAVNANYTKFAFASTGLGKQASYSLQTAVFNSTASATAAIVSNTWTAPDTRANSLGFAYAYSNNALAAFNARGVSIPTSGYNVFCVQVLYTTSANYFYDTCIQTMVADY